MSETIEVFAPATVANVACGYDILGFALEKPGDTVRLRLSKKKGVRILSIKGDEGRLPKEAEKNTAGVSILKYLEFIKADFGVEMELIKDMPLGSGLGSSAASSVASIYALNKLLNDKLELKELLRFAMEGEKIACGASHADNVAPALYGGFVLIRSYDPLDVISIPFPDDLFATVAHPHIEIRTEDARNILKKQIPLKSAITQWANTAGLIAGLMKNDYELIGRSLQDVIIEPIRSLLMPNFDEIKAKAIDGCALGCSISGSGPSMFALSKGNDQAIKVGKIMENEFKKINIGSDIFISKINPSGPKIIKK